MSAKRENTGIKRKTYLIFSQRERDALRSFLEAKWPDLTVEPQIFGAEYSFTIKDEDGIDGQAIYEICCWLKNNNVDYGTES